MMEYSILKTLLFFVNLKHTHSVHSYKPWTNQGTRNASPNRIIAASGEGYVLLIVYVISFAFINLRNKCTILSFNI